MKIIGLTGNTGSGKTTVSNILALRGGYIIDADEISHEVIMRGAPAYQEVVNQFGKEILDDTLEINRKKLGSIVFSNKKKLDKLSEMIHKYVIASTEKQIEAVTVENKYSFIVIDAPLLIEARMHHICDEVWVIYADEETRIQRIMRRENMIMDSVVERVRSQTQYEELKRYATRIIYNNDDIEQLQIQIKHALLNFIKL